MFVAWLILLLLDFGLAVAKLSPSNFDFTDLNCSSLCGLPFKPTYDQSPGNRDITVNIDGQCARESQLSVRNWEKSARRFLQLINMNDTDFDCPKWNMVSRAPNYTELPLVWRYPFSSEFRKRRFQTSVVEPAGTPGHCNITVDRGVVERNSRVYWMETDLQYGGQPLTTIGSLVSLWTQVDTPPLRVHLQGKEPKRCRGNNCPTYQVLWLPTSTFGTSVPHKNYTTEHYSIFAKWKFHQIPGIDRLMVKFRASVADFENLANELSLSNIAILSLPLLVAIPPISLLERVSTVTTVWYVFGTDILAAFPLLIKGFELAIVYPRTRVKMYSTLSVTGKKYGVYERWFTECKPPVGKSITNGTIIISVALWFMMASSYCEFAFWRALQYQYGRLNNVGEIVSDVTDDQCEQEDESKSQDSERTCCSWYARFRSQILAGTFLILIVLFISSIPIYATSSLLFSLIFSIVTSFVLVVFRTIATNRFSQLVRWRFLFGLVFCPILTVLTVFLIPLPRNLYPLQWNTLYASVLGFVGGPLYLILHSRREVRESKNWGDVSDGANIGVAGSCAFLAVEFGSFFRCHLTFTWIYGATIIILHVVRSKPSDRLKWRYGLNGFAAGMLFGAFGIFFKRCFPETVIDKQARANYHGGIRFGTIFLLTVVNLLIV